METVRKFVIEATPEYWKGFHEVNVYQSKTAEITQNGDEGMLDFLERKNKASVENEALSTLLTHLTVANLGAHDGDHEAIARLVITVIAQNKVPHVSIKY